jgi:flagella basal body P-ring formation protein FlgA
VLVFWRDEAVIGRVPVSLDLSVPPEALIWEVPKGASITVVVQRAGIEVSAPAVASTDGDIGDVVSVLLRPSGRSMRARIATRERAIAIEDGR